MAPNASELFLGEPLNTDDARSYSNDENDLPVPIRDARWDAAKAMVEQRLAASAMLAGQSVPPLSFARRFVEFGPDMWTSASCGAFGTDRVGVNLHHLFGPTPPAADELDDPGVAAVVDGFLLHELGHRRHRNTLRFLVDVDGVVVALAVAFLIYFLSSVLFDQDYMGWWIVASVAVVGAWLAVRVPVGRWHECQADDHVLDVGGIERWNYLVRGLAATPFDDDYSKGGSTVHMSVGERDLRQQNRFGRSQECEPRT